MARSYKKLLPDAGLVLDHYGPESAKPARTLVCNGAAVSRATYARLFAVIGTTHGVGDGSTTFNLPDLRGRASVGRDDMGGASANVVTAAWASQDGGQGGEEKHTPTTTETAPHAHGLNETQYQVGGSQDGYPYDPNNSTPSYSGPGTLSAGGGGAFNVMQPGAACIKVITF